MPARKGWVEEVTQYFFWALSDAFPSFRHRLRYEVTPGNGMVQVYFSRVSPRAVLEQITPEFFKRRNVALLSWEPVVRTGEGWKPLEAFDDERQAALTMVDFGWRYRESVLLEPYPIFLVEPKSATALPRPPVPPPIEEPARAERGSFSGVSELRKRRMD